MQWWIGQVTDPDKGKWGDSLEKTRAANGEDLYGFRCRVRIIGYHDCADDLPDEWETERQSSGESTLLRIPRELGGELAAALNQSELAKEVTETEHKTR